MILGHGLTIPNCSRLVPAVGAKNATAYLNFSPPLWTEWMGNSIPYGVVVTYSSPNSSAPGFDSR